ncbi:DgyrCDS13652 [Dimorphilus gyrociliatus]|uniref:DgyrCDS13652 n=1 Tax=Dimorphilus gyrociliatus TaxID=2664684 RepID=A0A7I8WBC6_9ANNE|nr:DgyrCDS13652 [Dimorphilus gyrociliatus]
MRGEEENNSLEMCDMTELNEETTTRLIKLVKINPIIWESMSCNKKDEEVVWKGIGNQLGLTGNRAKQVFDKLRECFYQDVNRQDVGDADKFDKINPYWKFFPLLNFLKPKKASKPILIRNHSPREKRPRVGGDFEDTYGSESLSTRTSTATSPTFTEGSTTTTGKRRVFDEKDMHTYFMQFLNESKKSIDEDEIFANFLYTEIKKLPTASKDELKWKIHSLIRDEKQRIISC